MVDVRTQVKVDEGSLQRGLSRLVSVVSRRLSRAIVPSSKPLVIEAVNEAITNSQNRFIPSQVAAGELGIGAGGTIDDDRRTNAWRALLTPPNGQGDVTTIEVVRIGQERGGVIIEARININEQAFFNTDRARIPTPDSDEIDEIPWMDWFINGQTVQGHRFSSRSVNREVSRTGRGIMIRGGVWTFTPRGQNAFGRTLDEARRAINRRLKEGLGARILRRLR